MATTSINGCEKDLKFYEIDFIILIFFFVSCLILFLSLLQRGSMFVFSMQQFSMLIDFEQNYDGNKLDSLLDLGAGDGAVTAKMTPFFNKVNLIGGKLNVLAQNILLFCKIEGSMH